MRSFHGKPCSEYLAHSANAAGHAQTLVAHLHAVAERSAEHAAAFSASALAINAGLWHDVGKFSDGFQAYLSDPKSGRGPDHSSAGAALAAETLPLIAPLVAGHHGGLPSQGGLRERVRRVAKSEAVQGAIEIARVCLGLESEPNALLPEWLPSKVGAGIGAELLQRRYDVFLRFLFSSLVDADFLDTERHFHVSRSRKREVESELPYLWDRFQEYHRDLRKSAERTPVNDLRNEIYTECLQAPDSGQGAFRLAVPTGGGKTLSGMAFALRHALRHGLRRIIVAIPYTSIIEQTAQRYREIFGEVVLEHHSAVAPDELTDPVTYEASWARLASENWDAPIVVTTKLQLFESLFANRPGKCRKLHNVARSVVILDEAQTLPPKLLAPTIDMLNELVAHYGVTAVFSTATQPAVSERPYRRLFENARDIVENPDRYFRRLERVRYEVPAAAEAWDWDRVAAEMTAQTQALAVVNTKRDAAELLSALGDAPDVFHLSTSLCGLHRTAVLEEVKARLAQREPCLLVSTQVVEAGVDIDFPLVLRAMGPLDRIVQAAGRCNREGRLGERGGRVVVFEPADGSMPPGEYRTGAAIAAMLLAEGADLARPSTHRTYFEQLSRRVDLDAKGIQSLRAGLNFPEVALRYRLIEDDTVPMLVPYEPAADKIRGFVDALRRQDRAPLRLFREMQPFLVNLRRRRVQECVRDGRVQELVPGLLLWRRRYDRVRGVELDAVPAPDEFVV